MEWLFKEDDYSPIKDKKNYIDKSIFSLLGILSKIRQEDKSSGSVIYRISPPVKFIFTFVLVILLALSRNPFFVGLIDSYFILTASLLLIKDIKKIFMIAAIVFIFSFILLLPSILLGNISNSLLICFKIFGTVLSLNILSYTTKWRHITRSLKIFFVPEIFILIMDMTLKYIVIFGDFSINVLHALKKKSVGYDSSKHTSLSNMIGVLFLKSKEMAEETYNAMKCRGFTGEYKIKTKFKIKINDLLYITINIFLIYLFLTLGKGKF